MSYLVTGGFGYTGRHIVRRLLDEGERVVSYDRDYGEDDRAGLALVQGELFDLPRLLGTLRDHGVERVLHTAAMSHPDLSVDLPITTVAANATGTTHLYEAARLAGVRRVVNFSSECAYGDVAGPVSEDAPLRPTTPYGATKVFTELLGDVYGRRRMMFVALAVMILGSAACALAPSLPALIAARILQGLGGGGLMTLSQALISESVPPRDRARYQGYLAAVVVFSNAFGPVVGGWLTSLFGWRSIFYVNILPGIAVTALSACSTVSRIGGALNPFDGGDVLGADSGHCPAIQVCQRLQ